MMPRLRMPSRVMACFLLAAPYATGVAAQPASVANGTQNAALEKRITDLHNRLKITPAEQKPFDDFAQVMRDNAQRMDGLMLRRRSTAAAASAVDQMREYSEMAQAHAEDLQHLTAAFSALYDVLSPDQKKAADQSFRQLATTRRGAAG